MRQIKKRSQSRRSAKVTGNGNDSNIKNDSDCKNNEKSLNSQVKGRPPNSKYDLSEAALAYTSSELNHKVELMKRGRKLYDIDEQELQFF